MHAFDTVLAKLVLDRGLDAEKNAQRGKRTGIAASSVITFDGQTGDKLRALGDGSHVGFAEMPTSSAVTYLPPSASTASAKAASISGVLALSWLARITALPPPMGRPAIAFL